VSAGTGQWPAFTGLGGAVHLVQTERTAALDELLRAVKFGSADEIRAASEHLEALTGRAS
jgi:hypothetical protein